MSVCPVSEGACAYASVCVFGGFVFPNYVPAGGAPPTPPPPPEKCSPGRGGISVVSSSS